MPKITVEKFMDLFYKKHLSLKEISKQLNCHISSISTFRKRHNLPKRGWSNGHPMLGKKHKKSSLLKISNSRKGKNIGSKNHNWKGGSYIDSWGYRWIKSEYGLKSNQGYIKEHRLVMTNHLGRPLSNSEIIHHVNGCKLDNRIENLCLHTRSSHAKLHHELGTDFRHKH